MINYYLLTKPGIILGNLLTVAAGFFLASKGTFNFTLFLAVLSGLTLIIASACVFNNYIDRDTDKKMARTKERALVTGTVKLKNALFFGTLLAVAGNVILLLFTNTLTAAIADIGFGIYVFLYSIWKSRTIYATAIGSLAGAIPPVAGYCAAGNRLDSGALILFVIMVLWQMPHFFSIAIVHLQDYKAAGLPVLPIEKGLHQTKIRMTLYIAAFIPAACLLTVFRFTGYMYVILATGFALAWFLLCLKGFRTTDTDNWSKNMFRLSLLVIMAVCSGVFVDTLYTG